jgi:mono/diheme cytochrome c family protein
MARTTLPALALLSMLAACEHAEADASVETPYAARLATTKPAYVRTASTSKHDAAKPAEVFVEPQYTAAQALAGAEVYKATCARCHAPTQWKGGTFAAAWQDRRLSDFHDLVSVTMPQDAPGSLAPDQYVNVTAYVLELAGFASGPVPLRGDTAMLRHARLSMKVPTS